MRRIAMTVGLAALIGLGGCAGSGQSRDELEAENARLRDQLDTVRVKLVDVEDAASDLDDAVGRLDQENWQSVVPDIRSASEAVASAQEEATQAAAE